MIIQCLLKSIVIKVSCSYMSYSYLFKFIIIGDQSVGKSCILMQFIDKQFKIDCDATIGVQFGSKTIQHQNQVIKMQIWDTAGQEAFKSITRSYYRGTIGAILVYDVTVRKTFESIARWLQQTRNFATTQKLCILLVGNKIDNLQSRQVTYEQGAEFANQNGLLFVECSAKTGYNVDSVFQNLCSSVLQLIQKGQIDTSDQSGGVKIGEYVKTQTQIKRKSCC